MSLASNSKPSGAQSVDGIMKDFLDNRVKGKLLTKKKTKQLKLRQALVQRNFQKYPLKSCVYDSTLKKHVHEPGRYRKEFSTLELTNASCCPSCCLRPCVMVGKRVQFLESLKCDHEDPDFAIRNAETLALILFQKFCGKLWMSRMKIKPAPPPVVPSCVKGALSALLRHATAEVNGKLAGPHQDVSSSSSSEDEEFHCITGTDSKDGNGGDLEQW